jgi:glycosyltransferase involved in cell wall biosynthesis
MTDVKDVGLLKRDIPSVDRLESPAWSCENPTMKVAIVTDLPFLCEKTRYLNELELRLANYGICAKTFVMHGIQNFNRIRAMAGVGKIAMVCGSLDELSKFDLIHVQFTHPLGVPLSALSSLKLFNKPVIIHTHGYDVFTVPEIGYGIRRKTVGRLLTEFAWKRSSRIIAVCERARHEIERAGIDRRKIDLLYNGVDQNLFTKTNSLSPQLSQLRQENDILFLNVAAQTPVKNQSRMIKAFNSVADKYGSKYRIKLVLVGQQRDELNINSSQNSTIFLGKITHKELPYLYSVVDVFVLPSLSEAHPWSILEAMSCQLPVIASNVGGIPETLEGRFLVNPIDVSDIEKKFEWVIEMGKAERDRIGRENRETILDRFTLRDHVVQLKRIYESI